jgi:uncharacterized membrane protein
MHRVRIFASMVLLLIAVCCMGSLNVKAEENSELIQDEEQQYVQEPLTAVRGRVLEILEKKVDEIEYSGGSIGSEAYIMKVRISEGAHKNEEILAVYQLNSFNPAYNIEIKKDDGVLLYLEEDDDGKIVAAYVAELLRENHLLFLGILFIALLILIGRMRGVKATISLVLTCVAIVKVLLPSILKGYNPVLVTTGVCITVIAVSLLIISGFNKKTLCAVIGTSGGLIIAGIIALIIGNAARLTGLGNEEAQMLMYIPQNIKYDFRGILFASILIGALGAVMDIGMSIASSMCEIELAKADISTKDLIKAGMNVGKDIMATMSNTLILAYAGGSLQLMLLLMAYDIPFTEIVNADFMASEVLRALAGSIGLIFTIPITAIAAVTFRKSKDTPQTRIIEKNPDLFPEQ